MSQGLFARLPSEITVNILSRLPAKSTMICKCVCKPWLDLLTTPEFVKSHLSKSVSGLAVYKEGMHLKPFKIVEFVDKVDPNCDEHRWNTVFNLDFSFYESLHSLSGDLFLCNPITREYIKLPCPRGEPSLNIFHYETFGFGVSKVTGQYKLVRMFSEVKVTPADPGFRCNPFKCQVYTVGTGWWRAIAPDEPYTYIDSGGVVFVNGNLNFMATDYSNFRVSCLDLETELFSTFALPPRDPHKHRDRSVLRDCLCVCANSYDKSTCGYEIDIWLMKEYGDESSWTKEYVIRKEYRGAYLGFLCPIKVFEDGGILMIFEGVKPLYYSGKTKTIEEVDLSGFGRKAPCSTAIYAPSFVSLKTLAAGENVYYVIDRFMKCRYDNEHRRKPSYIMECMF